MFVGLFLIAYFTSSVTSSLTVQRLEGDINSKDDLRGKIVAAVQGTTSSEYLLEQGIETKPYKTFDDAITGLRKEEVDAFVYDAPVLDYFISENGETEFKVIPKSFKPESYGIALKKDSPLRDDINKAILRIKENGVYDSIYKKWFGEN